MRAITEQQPFYNQEDDDPQEACGITAIYSKYKEIISPSIVDLQRNLQHRGRDSAGIATFDESTGKIVVYKDLGKVREVFPQGFNFEEYNLLSRMAIGHNRYGTSGDNQKDSKDGSQPMVAEWNGRTVAIAYNGNIPDKERQKLKARIPVDMSEGANFDTVDIVRAIVSADGTTWEERIKNGLKDVRLAYSLTILTDGGEVFGLRGPTGTWPLWVGEDKDRIIFASETRVDKSSSIIWREVNPGELVKATPDGVESKQIFPKIRPFFCGLHDDYQARRDSIMTVRNGEPITYGEFRNFKGRLLARERPFFDADIYAGIPETGLDIVEGYCKELGKEATPLITLMVGYNGDRAFLGRNDDEINSIISGKYAIFHTERVKDKKVFLADDSLIRGKTTGGDRLKGVKGVVELVQDAGAAEVYLALTLDKFVNGCDMGIFIRKNQLTALLKRDDGTYEELDEESIAKKIGADSVHFLSVESIKDAYEWVYGEREIVCLHCMGQPHPLDILSRNISKDTREPVLVYSSP